MIQNYQYDEVLNQTAIVLFLKRKWEIFGFKFLFIQFILFATLLVSLTVHEIGNEQV